MELLERLSLDDPRWRRFVDGHRDATPFHDPAWALLLAYPLGMIGVLTPYASGQNAVYYGSGYIKRKDFWLLGFVLGCTYMAVYLTIIVKWLEYLGV